MRTDQVDRHPEVLTARLVERVAVLERRLKLMASLLAGACVAGLILLFLDSGSAIAARDPQSIPSVIEAREFRLLGVQGKLLGRWGTGRGRELPYLRLFDQEGRETAAIVVSGPGCGGVFLYDAEERSRIALTASEGEAAGLFLRADGVFRATFSIDKAGTPLVFVKEPDEERAGRLKVRRLSGD